LSDILHHELAAGIGGVQESSVGRGALHTSAENKPEIGCPSILKL
jgi:hypothetical protein